MKSAGSAPKKNSPELQTFFTSVGIDLFSNTKPNNAKDNLSKEERNGLENWRKGILFNKESELLMRLQDKSNWFVTAYKETLL